jgi:hypothetical protein
MTDFLDTETTTPTLTFPLDYAGQEVLVRVVRWSKVVGFVNIGGGGLQCLSALILYEHFALALMALAAGFFMIFLGTRLTAAAAQFRYALQTAEGKSLLAGLDQIRQYLFLTGVMYLAIFLVILLTAIFISLFGMAVDTIAP